MRLQHAVNRLKDQEASLRKRGATALYLFGSTARDEARPESDVDVFIEYDPRSRFNGFDLVALKRLLEEQLGVTVDLTTRNGLHPMLKAGIEREALKIF
jgi:hypothetical protein